MKARTHLGFAAWLTIACAGCTVGPNYNRPKAAVPENYRGMAAGEAEAAKAETISFGDHKWWDVFQDETLRDLIATALRENYDARIAASRILEARALLGITRADQFPSISAGASALNQRFPEALGRPALESSAIQVDLGFSWELDFWGKFRRATESARAGLLVSEWARREVISALVSDLAIAYFQLRELDYELEISRKTLATRRDSLKLTQTLADGGATSMLDVRQAEQLVYAAEAVIPDLEGRIEQQENFISTLLGRNPEGVPRGRALTDQPHAPEVPAGLPSALLERRHDIRQAEQELIALNAQIGVARAAFFPSISLTGAGGYQSSALSNLFTGPAGLWSFGGGLTQPLFAGGRIRNNLRFAEARQQTATLLYQRTIQQAFREVSDSLVGYRKSREFRAQQERLTRSAEDATQLSNMRYSGGVTSYLEVLDTDTRYFNAQITLAQAQFNELRSLVQIYRALGGGWRR